jgi:hypothetical protein
MPILSGRYGKISYSDTGVAPTVEIVSLNTWKADFKTEYEDVSCYGDPNKVYVPGMMDVAGGVGGFWNSSETALFDAAKATTPGLLELMMNANEPTFLFSGLAYLDASIDCSMKAPKVAGNFRAAGPWTGPTGS